MVIAISDLEFGVVDPDCLLEISLFFLVVISFVANPNFELVDAGDSLISFFLCTYCQFLLPIL